MPSISWAYPFESMNCSETVALWVSKNEISVVPDESKSEPLRLGSAGLSTKRPFPSAEIPVTAATCELSTVTV